MSGEWGDLLAWVLAAALFSLGATMTWVGWFA